MYTASQALRLQGFGTFTYVRPAYGPPSTNYGLSLGTDLDFNTHTWVKPGFEIRGTRSSGDQANEYTYGGGPRLILPLPHIQPYGDFLLSGGKIDFNHPANPFYQEDRSAVYSYGGGADFLLTRSWALKVDVQSERWKLSHLNPPFHPLVVGVGFRYEAGGRRRRAQ